MSNPPIRDRTLQRPGHEVSARTSATSRATTPQRQDKEAAAPSSNVYLWPGFLPRPWTVLLSIGSVLLGYSFGKSLEQALKQQIWHLSSQAEEMQLELVESTSKFRQERLSNNALLQRNQDLTMEKELLEGSLAALEQKMGNMSEQLQSLEGEYHSQQEKIDALEDQVRTTDRDWKVALQEGALLRDQLAKAAADQEELRKQIQRQTATMEELREGTLRARRLQQVFQYTLTKCAPDLALRLAAIQADDFAAIERILQAANREIAADRTTGKTAVASAGRSRYLPSETATQSM